MLPNVYKNLETNMIQDLSTDLPKKECKNKIFNKSSSFKIFILYFIH